MKNEEFRQSIPSDIRTHLPKDEAKPCMRGTLNVDLYNRTGEIVMVEPLTEFVPPIDLMAAPAFNPVVKRRGMRMKITKMPLKEVLEKYLRSGMSAVEIAEKCGSKRITVYNWIKSYGLQGIKGQTKPDNEIDHGTPTLNEIEKFHTDMPPNELPKIGAGPAPLRTIDDILTDVRAGLVALDGLYMAQAKKSLRDKLLEMLAEVLG